MASPTTLLKARSLSKQDLARLVSATKGAGIKVVDWHILGQPAPESVYGTVTVSAGKAPGFLRDLLRLKGFRPRVEVFPLGIPFPRQYNIRFRV